MLEFMTLRWHAQNFLCHTILTSVIHVSYSAKRLTLHTFWGIIYAQFMLRVSLKKAEILFYKWLLLLIFIIRSSKDKFFENLDGM